MGNVHHLQLLGRGAGGWNAWRADAQGIRPDLSSSDLSGTNLSGMDLSHASLSGADLRKALLAGTSLRSSNLAGAVLDDADLSGADLSEANLAGASLLRANLAGATLRNTNLAGANLSEGANLSGATVNRANLAGANLAGGLLYGASLQSANLAGADLRGVAMAGANLTDAGVSGAQFDSADVIPAARNAASVVKLDLDVVAEAPAPSVAEAAADPVIGLSPVVDEVPVPPAFDAEDMGAIERLLEEEEAALPEEVALAEEDAVLPEEVALPEDAVLPEEVALAEEVAPSEEAVLPEEDALLEMDDRLQALLQDDDGSLAVEAESLTAWEPHPEAMAEEEALAEDDAAVAIEPVAEDLLEVDAPLSPDLEPDLDAEFDLDVEPQVEAEALQPVQPTPAPVVEYVQPEVGEDLSDDRLFSFVTKEMAILALYSTQIGKKNKADRNALLDLMVQYNRTFFPPDVRVPMTLSGSALLAGFENPTDALRCGSLYIDMLRGMQVESYVAVNWGEATIRCPEDGDGHDELIANSISLAARLMPIGTVGEVLVLEELYSNPGTQQDLFAFERVSRKWKAVSAANEDGIEVLCYSVTKATAEETAASPKKRPARQK